jgi:hypothetical protein
MFPMKEAVKNFSAIAAVLLGIFMVYDGGISDRATRDSPEPFMGALLVAAGLTPLIMLWRRRNECGRIEAALLINNAAGSALCTSVEQSVEAIEILAREIEAIKQRITDMEDALDL